MVAEDVAVCAREIVVATKKGTNAQRLSFDRAAILCAESAVFECDFPVHDHEIDAGRELIRIINGSIAANRCGIKHRQICYRAFVQQPAPRG